MDTITESKESGVVQIESDLVIRTADWMARARNTINELVVENKQLEERALRAESRYLALCKQVGIAPPK